MQSQPMQLAERLRGAKPPLSLELHGPVLMLVDADRAVVTSAIASTPMAELLIAVETLSSFPKDNFEPRLEASWRTFCKQVERYCTCPECLAKRGAPSAPPPVNPAPDAPLVSKGQGTSEVEVLPSDVAPVPVSPAAVGPIPIVVVPAPSSQLPAQAPETPAVPMKPEWWENPTNWILFAIAAMFVGCVVKAFTH